jgi:hypothetical protein
MQISRESLDMQLSRRLSLCGASGALGASGELSFRIGNTAGGPWERIPVVVRLSLRRVARRSRATSKSFEEDPFIPHFPESLYRT